MKGKGGKFNFRRTLFVIPLAFVILSIGEGTRRIAMQKCDFPIFSNDCIACWIIRRTFVIRDKDIHYISLEYIPRCWKIHFTNLLRKTKLYEKKRKIERFNALYLTLDRKSRLKKKTIIFKKLFITHVHLFIYQDRVTCKNLKHDSLPPPLVHVSIARDTMSGTGVQSVRKNDVQISKLL